MFGCGNLSSLSLNNNRYDYEGNWYLNGNKEKKLKIYKIENETYILKFNFEEISWEGIGIKINNELLAIFKYQNSEGKGYVTLKFTNDNTVHYESINTNGTIRASGQYSKELD